MRRNPMEISPRIVYMAFMLFQFLALFFFFVKGRSPWVFLLFLMSIFSIVIRWRFPVSAYTMLFDVSLYIVLSLIYPGGSIFLILFVFYFTFQGRYFFALYPLGFGLYFSGGDAGLYYAGVFLLGITLHLWNRESRRHQENEDELRSRIYQLEETQANLLLDYQDTERMSRLTERQRIAEILHDNLGHELTAAHLSLKAAETIIQNEDTPAKIPIRKSMERLEKSLSQLKESVRQLEPDKDTLDLNFEELTDRFPLPVKMEIEGDVRQLKPYVRQLLQMSLKEALTNATKHAHPNLVKISLEVTDTIARLTVKNDGIYEERSINSGNGIRYMRKRLEAVHGSLSTQKGKDDFLLVIIIPLQKG